MLLFSNLCLVTYTLVVLWTLRHVTYSKVLGDSWWGFRIVVLLNYILYHGINNLQLWGVKFYRLLSLVAIMFLISHHDKLLWRLSMNRRQIISHLYSCTPLKFSIRFFWYVLHDWLFYLVRFWHLLVSDLIQCGAPSQLWSIYEPQWHKIIWLQEFKCSV